MEHTRETHPKQTEKKEDEGSRAEENSKFRAQKTMDDAIANAQQRSKQEAINKAPIGDAAADTTKEEYIARNKEAERVSQNKESKERPSEKITTKSFEKRQELDKKEGKGKPERKGKPEGKGKPEAVQRRE